MTGVSQKSVTQQFDSFSDSYNDTTNDSLSFTGMKVDFFVRAKAHHILELSKAHFEDIQTLDVLDIGCGVGNYHDLLLGQFASLQGVEVSEGSLDVARKKNPNIDYKHYDGLTLPYADNSFDLCYTVCVMHHVPPENWENFAAEMMRVTKPGGIALIFEHNPHNPLTMKAVNDCPYDADAVLLRPKVLKSHFEKTAPAELSSHHILTIPAISGLPKRIDRVLGKLPFGTQYCVKVTK